MPELPEVEVVRRGLAGHLLGRRLDNVAVLHPRPVRSHEAGPDAFAAEVSGRDVTDVRRRGKYLWLVLDGDDALVIHLGMSGQFRINAPGDPVHPHTRLTADLDARTQVRFLDQRMFGGLTLAPGMAECPVPHIARDPFDPEFDVAQVAARLRSRRTTVKRALLNQSLVSGIGNIYADETLWRRRMHHERPTLTLDQAVAEALLTAARTVMQDALAAGGTSFDSLYVNVNGESGYFSRSLNAYGRTDQPCDRCGTPIVRDAFMNRSSFRCPSCQRLTERPPDD